MIHLTIDDGPVSCFQPESRLSQLHIDSPGRQLHRFLAKGALGKLRGTFMVTTTFARTLRRAATAALLGSSLLAHAGLVEVKFGTNAFSLVSPNSVSSQAFSAALTSNLIDPSSFGGISGRFFYENTTPGNANTATRTYNSAVESLEFSIAGWFSQSLTGIGNGGDILVSNDITAQADVDRILARVACAPAVAVAGTGCVAQPFNFNYSVFDANTGVTWVLDEFELFLEENGPANPLSGVGLPTKAQWESTEWTTRRVDLRFNPNCTGGGAAGCANVLERATLSFLVVPEPGTLALVGLGLMGLGAASRRKG